MVSPLARTSARTRRPRLAALLAGALGILGCEGGAPPVLPPAAIEAEVSPSRTWYHTGQSVQLAGVVTDANGEEIPDVEVRWTAEPAGAATPGAASTDPRLATFTLAAEGRTTFTGCVVPSDELVPPTLCDSLSVRVDDGAPSLEVESPLPGAELDDAEGIVVRGSVADRSMVRVYVNGTLATPDPMGRFEATIEGFFGVNHLVVTATDGITDAPEVEMDVLWAPTFSPAMGADGTPEIVLDDGLELWLGQDFFDDGVPLDLAATPVSTRDLADVLELVVSSLDIGGLVPDPVVDSPPTFTMRVTNATIAEPHVELDLTDDGADLFIRIGRVEADTSGGLMFETTSLPLTGHVSASAVAFAHLTIDKADEDAEVVVTLEGLTVGLESLEGSFASEETAAVFRLAEGLLRSTLETALVDAVGASLEDSVPALLGDALNAIDSALDQQEIVLDSAPFPPVTIEIDGGIRELNILYLRELQATLRTSVGTTTPSVHPDSLGVARLDAFEFTPPFVNRGALQVGVRIAFLNGLLHALWSSGMLDIDVSPILPASIAGIVSEARLEARLPPVLRPPRVGETDDLRLALGQLELALTYMGEPVRFAVSLEAGVIFDVTGSRISVDVSETPDVSVWTLQAPSNPRLLTADTVRMLLLDLWPNLRESLTGGLAFDLPIPALGDLGGLAPDLAGFTLALESGEDVRVRGGVLVLDARLEGTLP